MVISPSKAGSISNTATVHADSAGSRHRRQLRDREQGGAREIAPPARYAPALAPLVRRRGRCREVEIAGIGPSSVPWRDAAERGETTTARFAPRDRADTGSIGVPRIVIFPGTFRRVSASEAAASMFGSHFRSRARKVRGPLPSGGWSGCWCSSKTRPPDHDGWVMTLEEDWAEIRRVVDRLRHSPPIGLADRAGSRQQSAVPWPSCQAR